MSLPRVHGCFVILHVWSFNFPSLILCLLLVSYISQSTNPKTLIYSVCCHRKIGQFQWELVNTTKAYFRFVKAANAQMLLMNLTTAVTLCLQKRSKWTWSIIYGFAPVIWNIKKGEYVAGVFTIIVLVSVLLNCYGLVSGEAFTWSSCCDLNASSFRHQSYDVLAKHFGWCPFMRSILSAQHHH